ncbi:MAG: M23 family metallopeptidase [Myxococcota bacterium]
MSLLRRALLWDLTLCVACAPAGGQPPPSEPPAAAPAVARPEIDEPSPPPRPEAAPPQPEVATSFQFPTEGYEAGSAHGRRFLVPNNHVGDDSKHEHLTPVFAIGHGIVRQARRGGLEGYGSVVAVEHQLPSGEYVVSIYGHLCNHSGHRIPVDVGDVVRKGELLGYIGDDDENGHGPEHIHLGIRRGEYDGHVCGYVGPRFCKVSRFYDPTAFIEARLESD